MAGRTVSRGCLGLLASWAVACAEPRSDEPTTATEASTGWSISECADPGCQDDQTCIDDHCVAIGSSTSEASTGGSSTGSSSTSADDSSTGAPGCYHFEGTDCSAAVQPNLACGTADACTELELVAGQPFDAAAAMCITDGLRDRVVGTYRIHYGIELTEIHRQIELLADGTAIVRERAFVDIGCSYFERWTGLAEPAYFDGCLAATEGEALFDCLDGLAGDSACVTASTCPQG